MSAGAPLGPVDCADHCVERLTARLQALVDQIAGVAEMLNAGMGEQAFGNLADHLRRCSLAGQHGIDLFAAVHGRASDAAYAEAVVEFMEAVG